MDDPILRKATSDDKEFAYRTKKAAFREYVEKVWGWDEEEQRRIHERRFASGDFRVIEVEGTDVGILALVRRPDCVNVKQMFLLPEHQGRGIGTACVKRLIAEAAASALPLRLQVLKVNDRAVAFYRRLGFGSTGESDTHILMERGSREDRLSTRGINRASP